MHVIITDIRSSSSRTIEMGAKRITALVLLVLSAAFIAAVVSYHAFLRLGEQNDWAIVKSISAVADAREVDAQNRYLRENLDVMAKRLGELQARLVQLDSLGERVAGMAGLDIKDIKAMPGSGGALVSAKPLTVDEFDAALSALERKGAVGVDVLTVLESRLADQKLQRALIPTSRPVLGGYLGSRFGRRIDPFTGNAAMHTGLDFPGPVGTPIYAAAGGVVVTAFEHAEYGKMVEIDHGNDIITRYAHASRIMVNRGDLVKRGQKIALIGSTGRSTGPHLHFEVWVAGQYKDPAKFLAQGQKPQLSSVR
jgi:murein DD-endopeptidase MepM/ murein hydrolase activator NlpD